MKQPLVVTKLPSRKFRHGKAILNADGMSREDLFKLLASMDPRKEAIRYSNTLKVAAGPTIMNGLLQGGEEPGWWKEAK